MLEFMQELPTAELILLIVLSVYGLMYGIKNTCHRLVCICTNDTLLQNDLGKLLDLVFYCGIIYLAVMWIY